MNNKKTLLLIDSFALIFRAYYAFPPTLKSLTGEPTNAVYGFASLLLDVLLKFEPDNVIAVFDSAGPTIRESSHSFYKANRAEADELFLQQIPRVRELIETFGIPVLNVEGYEADDVIATIDHENSGEWAKTIVVTGDQDLFQLVDSDTFVYLASRKFSESKLYDSQMVKDKLGILPSQVIEYKALKGDPSDNIPGVKGIGEKTAVELIQNFGDLENIYKNIEKIKKGVAEKLVNDQESALTSRSLATVFKDVPISYNFEDSQFNSLPLEKIKTLFNLLQFKSLFSRLEKLSKKFKVPEPVTLFSEDSFSSLPKEEVFKKWSGEEIISNKIYFFPVLVGTSESPLKIKLTKILFKKPNESEIFEVNLDNLQEFLKAISSVSIVGFNKKNFYHSVLNEHLVLTNLNFTDIGILSVIHSEGLCSLSLESILNFFQIESALSLTHKVAALEKIESAISTQNGNSANFDKVIDVENDIIDTIIEMERNGIGLDEDKLKIIEQLLELDLQKIKERIYKNVGHEFNVNSPKQLAEILFVEKNLPYGKKTKGGAYSTNETTLKSMKGLDPIIEDILNFRELDKLMGTYVKTLPSYVDSFTKRIHTTFDQLGAVSGRFSSKNPNLQNIPKDLPEDRDIRNCFVPNEGNVFISFDYSQQELRILASFSKEEKMIESFNNNEDVHALTASRLFEKEIKSVTPSERNIGKTINFSIIYGISSFGLSERMGISRVSATGFIKKFFEIYKNVDSFLKKSLIGASQNLFTETILGRRRRNEMIASNNRNLKSAAERELFNFIIQGSAADIMKLALKEVGIVSKKFDAKLLLQIHDEFLFEFPVGLKGEYSKKEFINEIKEVMLKALDIGVRYKVGVSEGFSWGSLKKLDIS